LKSGMDLGHELVIAHPKGYELDDELLEETRRQAEESGGRITISHDIEDAFEGVQAVYAKSWGSRNF